MTHFPRSICDHFSPRNSPVLMPVLIAMIRNAFRWIGATFTSLRYSSMLIVRFLALAAFLSFRLTVRNALTVRPSTRSLSKALVTMVLARLISMSVVAGARPSSSRLSW